MNAVAAVLSYPEPSFSAPAITAGELVAVRLADEGIPVRAIARSLKVPSEDIYEVLRDAIATGSITEMPKDDWPVGSTRGQRAAFNGTPLENEENLQRAIRGCFKVTRLEAAILSVLVKRTEATKAQLHIVIEQMRSDTTREATDPKMVDVIICHLRKKLKGTDLTIRTVWGIGYNMPLADREKAVHMVSAFVATEAM